MQSKQILFMQKLILAALLIFVDLSCQNKKEEKFDRFPAGKEKDFVTIGGINVPDSRLQIGLFASEPMVFNPTNMDIDHKGRVWVCEAYNYRNDVNHVPYEKKGDKIIIMEDKNGDGKANDAKIFYQGEDINAALGICVLGNKVIVSCSPNVFVFTDENGDDIPDKKEILFKTDGGYQSDHGIHSVSFGPDGNLYFNFGNYVFGLLDKNNQPIKDIYGQIIKNTVQPFQDGMAVRCDIEGKNFEVLGSNFRNNYELCVDSYGRIWQSDNDDDGVRSNRINYLLPYGNYGYKDEVSGADWRAYRTNKEDSVWKQHWHQNDPGVVPNLKVIGSGAPTGIFVYEGNLLPTEYQGNIFLGDAFNNDIIAYQPVKDKAGFVLENHVVLDASEKDQWFRPSDVTVAPDGSVFVADWYDTAVGGHFIGDLERGRIYKVSPKGTAKYSIPKYNFEDVNSCIEALKSPSNSVRYLAFTSLKAKGKQTEQALYQMAKEGNPVFTARALWLLKNIDSKYLEEFSKSTNEDIRAATVRMAKVEDNSPFFIRMSKDSSTQVRTAVATQICYSKNPEAWLNLANAYQSGDRWYLEALGIGAKHNWDSYLANYLKNKNWPSNPAALDIIWRSRAKETSQYLVEIIENTAFENSLRYFRAFDFQPIEAKNAALLQLLENSKSEARKLLIFKHFDTKTILRNKKFQSIIPRVLAAIKNDRDFLDIVTKYHFVDQKNRVLSILDNNSNPTVYRQAAQTANDLFGVIPLKEAVYTKPLNFNLAIKRIERMGLVDNEIVTKQLILIFTNRNLPLKMREAAILAMEGYGSDVKLWNLVKVNKVDKVLIPAAKVVLRKTFHNDIKVEFEHKFGSPEPERIIAMPSLKGGDAAKGKEIFTAMCSSCHKIGDVGIDFGPGLGQIGKKLTPEGIFSAVVNPNQGVNLGYETSQIHFTDGTGMRGIVTSKTASNYLIKTVGSSEPQSYPADKVKSVELIKSESLMPAFPLGDKQMRDLLTYLSSLK